MHFIFIVDSAGVAERVTALEQFLYEQEDTLVGRVALLEEQLAVVELALRFLAADPGSPTSAARRAREILSILEG